MKELKALNSRSFSLRIDRCNCFEQSALGKDMGAVGFKLITPQTLRGR